MFLKIFQKLSVPGVMIFQISMTVFFTKLNRTTKKMKIEVDGYVDVVKEIKTMHGLLQFWGDCWWHHWLRRIFDLENQAVSQVICLDLNIYHRHSPINYNWQESQIFWWFSSCVCLVYLMYNFCEGTCRTHCHKVYVLYDLSHVFEHCTCQKSVCVCRNSTQL